MAEEINVMKRLIFADIRKEGLLTEVEFNTLIRELPINDNVYLSFFVTNRQHEHIERYSGSNIRYVDKDFFGFRKDILVYDSAVGSHPIARITETRQRAKNK